MGVSMVGMEGPSPFGMGATILLLLVVVLWFVIATAAALRGGGQMVRNPVAQMYGYTVCLIAVILGLTSIAGILDAAFQRAYPLQSEYGYGTSLATFETYKATHGRERAMYGPQAEAQPDTASDATLRRRYDALVAERRSATTYRTSKAFVSGGFMLIVAAMLYVLHWRWLRRVVASAISAP